MTTFMLLIGNKAKNPQSQISTNRKLLHVRVTLICVYKKDVKNSETGLRIQRKTRALDQHEL